MQDSSLWYKDAIFYELYVRAFRDSNADGHGDLRGVIQKLDYLQGVNWNRVFWRSLFGRRSFG